MAILTEELTNSSRVLDKGARADNLKAFEALSSLGIKIQALSEVDRKAIEVEAKAATMTLIDSGEFDEDLYSRVVKVLEDYRNP
jgi:hypothetical protein